VKGPTFLPPPYSLPIKLALDYGPYGIRVLSINPGTVLTPLVKAQNAAGQRTGLGEFYPLRQRVGEVEEVCGVEVWTAGCPPPFPVPPFPLKIGDVAVFLASRQASFMTGSDINVDGGILAQGCWGH
jgi:NAD(P)-dependent dehydrogenase (short-subunit alcohol dehydrogenase family)